MKRRRKERLKERRIIAGVGACGILAMFFIVYFCISSAVNKVPENIIHENVYIDNVNVSGMTVKEAKSALKKKQAEYQKLKINLIAEEVTVEVSLADLGFCIDDIDKLSKDAVSYGKEGGLWHRYSLMKDLKEEKKVFSITFGIDEDTLGKVIQEKIPHLENGAKNATIKRENGKFVITEEKKGVTIDVEESAKRINTYLKKDWKRSEGESIELSMKVEEPKVTKALLSEIKDVLGTFTTNCGATGARVQNIKTGASRINGALLMPGEEFSANQAMKPYTKENGYTEAGAFENGKLVQSMGGGICQVSSTLYNALILAEIEIVERAAHSMLVAYVEPSMDAAIAGDYKDLKFKNNTDTPIYIEGYVSGSYITFKVYGKETRPASRTIKYVSEVLSTTPAGEKFQASGDPVGTLKKASSGYTGTKAKLWKIIYENGVEVSREEVNNSSYRASAAIWNVGTASDNAQAAAIVQKAISSNDRATIEAAIGQAQALIAATSTPTETPAPPTGDTPTTDPEAAQP